MNSNKIALSFDEAQSEIEEKIIALIKKDAICPRLHFWSSEERKSEDEILEEHDHIYYVKEVFKYKKEAKRPSIISEVGVHYTATTREMLNEGAFKLRTDTVADLKIWSKKAAKIVANFFKQQNGYFLTEIRFDFIPANKENTKFICPYLPLENVFFSKDLKDARLRNPIKLQKYLEIYLSDMIALDAYIAARNLAKNSSNQK